MCELKRRSYGFKTVSNTSMCSHLDTTIALHKLLYLFVRAQQAAMSLLVASCVCDRSSSTTLSLAKNAFVCSVILGSWIKNPPSGPLPKQNLGKRCFQNFILSRDGREKYRNKAELKQCEKPTYPTPAVYFCRCTIVFLCYFISALFQYFFRTTPT